MQRYQPLIQEDLNVGTERVWVTAPGGGELRATQLGLHSVARGQSAYTAAWTPGVVSSGGCVYATVSVPLAAVGDFVAASHDKILTNDLRISGNVYAAGVAQVVIHNPTATDITLPAGIVGVVVFPVTVPTTGTASGTVYYNNTNPGNEVGPGVAVVIAALGLSTTTNASGEYTFTGVTAGSVTVAADDGAGNTGSNTGTVLAGGIVAIDVVISGI
jgi:hypothetical protein